MKIGDVFSDGDFDRSRSGASLVAGQGVAPDQQAEAVKLGNRYGLHPDTARASLDELRQRADMEDRRKALDAAPGLRAWVAEKPQNPRWPTSATWKSWARWNGSSGLSPKGWAGSSLVRE